MRSACLSLILALVAFNQAGFAQVIDETQAPMTNFHVISQNLYRGARPEEAGLKYLASIGVKTIINIDDDKKAISNEQSLAPKYGITEISIPLSGFWAPSDKNIDRILSLMQQTTQGGVYVHCKHGEDRTGLVSSLYRIEIQGWPVDQATAEMRKNGYHFLLVGLSDYYEDRTEPYRHN